MVEQHAQIHVFEAGVEQPLHFCHLAVVEREFDEEAGRRERLLVQVIQQTDSLRFRYAVS